MSQTALARRPAARRRRPRPAGVDALTGLPDRAGLARSLGHSLSWRRRPGELVAALCVDLDRFGEINDRWGRAAGDALLRKVGERIIRSVRGGDVVAHPSPLAATSTVARLGGDEFVVVLNHVDRPEGAALAARRILEGLARPFRLGARSVTITASVGIAVQPPDGDDPDQLLDRATAAMRAAKTEPGSAYRFFNEGLRAAITRKLDIEGQLKGALARREFFLCYQPLVDSRTQALVGVEALLRWNRPGREPLSPTDFVPVAEECGMMGALGEWVLRQACAQMKAWLDEGLPSLLLSVNLSSCQLRDGDFASVAARVLDETGLDPRLLQIELTESGVIAQDASTITQLERLKGLGVSLAIDDFGTGYSALGYLRRFPVDVIKLDRSFVGAISASVPDADFVAAVIAMARRLNLTVVAEGVETPEQLSFLRDNACDQAQGFLFSQPLTAPEFRSLLQSRAGAAAVVPA
jgi:diguanylate cyclase (GGDEF)-like protein